MNEQEEFLKKINELTELALDQENVIFEDQLYMIFPEVKGDSTKLDIIKSFLNEKKIGLNKKLELNELITEDEKNYLDFYLEELKEIEELSKGEREGYLLSAMAGDEDAKLKIINDSLKNVVDISRLYAGQGVLVEDLIGEGNLALISALDFLGSCESASDAETLLSSRVMDAMQDLVAANMDESSSEEKLLKKVEKVSKAAKELSEAYRRKVTVDELALESKMSRKYIIEALKLTANKIEEIEIPEELK